MKPTLFLFFALISSVAFAQNKRMDSLRRQVDTYLVEDTMRVVYLNSLALLYVNFKPDSSIILAEKGLKLAEKISYPRGIAQSYTYQGVFYNNKDEYDKATELQLKALKINEELKNEKGIADNYLSLGFIQHKLKENEKALKYYEQALILYRKIGDKVNIARTTNNLGIIFKRLEKYDEALNAYEESLKIKEEIGDIAATGSTISNMAAILEYQNRHEEALEYNKRALAIHRKYKNEQLMSVALFSMANINLYLKRYDSALQTGFEALALAQKNGYKNDAQNAAEVISMTYEKQNNFEKALEYFRYAVSVKDSIFNLERTKAISNLQSTYELDKKAKEVELLNKNQELLKKDADLQRAESERLRNEALAFEKQAEADRLFALARAETDKRKQDSLMNLAHSNQLEADKHRAESLAKALEVQKANEAKDFQKVINYLIGFILFALLIFVFLILRNRRKLQIANANLSEANFEIMQKNEEINQQKEEIFQTLQIAEEQRSEIHKKNENIIASINYALRIQKAIIPSESQLNKFFPESFLFFRPRDIVSGDFYWFAEKGNLKIFAAGDCTGHGVSGAFMTMIANSILNQIVHEKEIFSPELILSQIPLLLETTLSHSEEKVKDGMDIGIITLTENESGETERIDFAGAMNSLFVFRSGKLLEYKADKKPIDAYLRHDFQKQVIYQKSSNSEDSLAENPITIYMASDGYQDQFGGENNTKYMIKNFKNLLADNASKNIFEQKSIFERNFDHWKKGQKQTDDVLLIGIRLSK